MKKSFLCLALALLLGLAFDAEARTTRDLVFEDDDETQTTAQEQAGQQTVAVKTTVLLDRGGQKNTVTPSHDFKSGDKVKLVFTPNRDGYVYWLAKGSSGNYSMLFPNEKSGMDNSVKRNEEYTVPMRGGFKFDDNPGSEELLCILSTERLADLDKAASEAFQNPDAVAKLEQKNSQKRTTRDLVFEDDDEEDVNTQSQTAAKGEPFVGHYVLKHN